MEAPSTPAVVATTVAVTISLLYGARFLLYPVRRPVIASPLARVGALPAGELAALEYQPDHFPGARDVATPVSCFCLSALLVLMNARLVPCLTLRAVGLTRLDMRLPDMRLHDVRLPT